MSSDEHGGLSNRESLDGLSIREMFCVATPMEKVEMVVLILSLAVLANLPNGVAESLLDDAETIVDELDRLASWVRAAVGVIRRA